MIAQAVAATLSFWTGPGDRACAGQCPIEWALSLLPTEQKAAVEAAMADEPRRMMIFDGQYIPLMTYYDGQPVAQRGVVASLTAPEPAEGWCIDGGCFLLIEGCKNWAFVERRSLEGSLVALPLESGLGRDFPRSSLLPDWTDPEGSVPFLGEGDEPEKLVERPVPAVGLPASFWLLGLGVLALGWRARG